MKELKRALTHIAPHFAARRRAALLLCMLAAVLPAAGCFESKVITSKVNPPSNPSRAEKMNGVFYALPRTVIKADVPVVKTVKKKAEFAEFAPCFFPGEDFVKEDATTFGVKADDVKFDTTFIPDSGEVYMIKTTGGMFETRNLELALTESGVFVKGSADVTNETIDLVTGGIKTGVGLLAKASSFGFLSGGTADTSGQARLADAQQQCQTVLGAAVVIDAGKFKKAFELYTRIVELQTRRSNILELTLAPATIPADTLKLTLAELDAAIKQLKDSGFFGTEEKLTWNASFRVNPQDPPAGNPFYTRPLMTLSATKGVCAILVNQGMRVDGRFKAKPEECREGAKEIRMKVALGEDGEGGPNAGGLMAEKVRAAQLRQSGDRGFYYRIPGRAIAYVVQDGEPEVEFARAPLSIAQYGPVVSLPASTGGRKTKYTLELFESSGGLKNFVMGSSALVQQKNITDLTDAVGTAIEAKGERNKAKAPADELQQLERQRKILEEKKKIRDLEGELNEEPDSDENND